MKRICSEPSGSGCIYAFVENKITKKDKTGYPYFVFFIYILLQFVCPKGITLIKKFCRLVCVPVLSWRHMFLCLEDPSKIAL